MPPLSPAALHSRTTKIERFKSAAGCHAMLKPITMNLLLNQREAGPQKIKKKKARRALVIQHARRFQQRWTSGGLTWLAQAGEPCYLERSAPLSVTTQTPEQCPTLSQRKESSRLSSHGDPSKKKLGCWSKRFICLRSPLKGPGQQNEARRTKQNRLGPDLP